MVHLIATLGKEQDAIHKIISSGAFEIIYLITTEEFVNFEPKNSNSRTKISLMMIDLSSESKEMVDALYFELKKNLTQDKILDMDIAVNISSGVGKEHAILLSAIMKLGYGIRLIDVDKTGKIVELL
ncbi:MAG: hypothetical protein ACP5NV_03235 [Candidatus Woesearchaeota archaeon]